MYGLFLDTERCPDGVELHQGVFHYRTDRREPFRLTLTNLENPVVVAFVNTTHARVKGHEDRRSKFLSKFGMLADRPKTPGRLSAGFFHAAQERFFHWLHGAGSTAPGPLAKGNRARTLQAINEATGHSGPINLLPLFDLAGEGGVPRMLLKVPDLLAFMAMEIAMVATNGARFAVCHQCSDVFLTGPLTWRRASAQYCTDRCRVAAMRARNATKGSVK